MNKAVFSEHSKRRYFELERLFGADLAVFVLCAYFDLPYRTELEFTDWFDYAKSLDDTDGHCFEDGATDFHTAQERGRSDEERWAAQWGIGSGEHTYSKADFVRLDELFRSYSARLVAAGGFDTQQEDTLRHCSRLALLRDKCVAKGDKDAIDKAAKLDKMIQDNLSAENLRKKDAKLVETAKFDGIVDAVRKKFGAKVDMTYDEAVEVCSRWMLSHHYPETKDAAEHVLLSLMNATRRNNDLPELDELPEQYRFSAACTEFEDVPNDMERTAYQYLNLQRRDGK